MTQTFWPFASASARHQLAQARPPDHDDDPVAIFGLRVGPVRWLYAHGLADKIDDDALILEVLYADQPIRAQIAAAKGQGLDVAHQSVENWRLSIFTLRTSAVPPSAWTGVLPAAGSRSRSASSRDITVVLDAVSMMNSNGP